MTVGLMKPNFWRCCDWRRPATEFAPREARAACPMCLPRPRVPPSGQIRSRAVSSRSNAKNWASFGFNRPSLKPKMGEDTTFWLDGKSARLVFPHRRLGEPKRSPMSQMEAGARKRPKLNPLDSDPQLRVNASVANALRQGKQKSVIPAAPRLNVVKALHHANLTYQKAATFMFACMLAAVETLFPDLPREQRASLASLLSPSKTMLHEDAQVAAEVLKLEAKNDARHSSQLCICYDEGRTKKKDAVSARLIWAGAEGEAATLPLGMNWTGKSHEEVADTIEGMAQEDWANIATSAYRLPIQVTDGAAEGMQPFGWSEFGVRLRLICDAHRINTTSKLFEEGFGSQSRTHKSVFNLAFDAINAIRSVMGVRVFFEHVANMVRDVLNVGPDYVIDIDWLMAAFDVPGLPHETRWMRCALRVAGPP